MSVGRKLDRKVMAKDVVVSHCTSGAGVKNRSGGPSGLPVSETRVPMREWNEIMKEKTRGTS